MSLIYRVVAEKAMHHSCLCCLAHVLICLSTVPVYRIAHKINMKHFTDDNAGWSVPHFGQTKKG